MNLFTKYEIGRIQFIIEMGENQHRCGIIRKGRGMFVYTPMNFDKLPYKYIEIINIKNNKRLRVTGPLMSCEGKLCGRYCYKLSLEEQYFLDYQTIKHIEAYDRC
jgi:hypothetical protein